MLRTKINKKILPFLYKPSEETLSHIRKLWDDSPSERMFEKSLMLFVAMVLFADNRGRLLHSKKQLIELIEEHEEEISLIADNLVYRMRLN